MSVKMQTDKREPGSSGRFNKKLRFLGGLATVSCWGILNLLLAQAPGSLCEDFNTGTASDWAAASTGVSIALSNVDSQDGKLDNFIRIGDMSGASFVSVPDRELSQWNPLLMSGCAEICWDLRIFDDGDDTSNRDLTPSVTLVGPAGATATFKANFTVSEAGGSNEGWHRICAPVRPLEMGQPPDDGTGTWTVSPPTAWTSILASGVAEITFPNYDTTGFDEEVDYDNICVAPCRSCLEQTTVRLLCEVGDDGTPTGDYLWTFQVKNLTGMTVNQLFIVAPGVSVDPPHIVFPNPLLDNETHVQTVRISGAVPGTLDLWLTIHGETMDDCCRKKVRLELPPCDCAQVVREVVASCLLKPWPPPFKYTFKLQSLSSTVGSILVSPVLPTGPQQLILQPNYLPVSPTIAPGETTGNLSIAISGPLAQEGEEVCFRISTHDPEFEECCSIVKCVTLPRCPTPFEDQNPKDRPRPSGSGSGSR